MTPSQIWANDALMALNADIGLNMIDFAKLVQGVERIFFSPPLQEGTPMKSLLIIQTEAGFLCIPDDADSERTLTLAELAKCSSAGTIGNNAWESNTLLRIVSERFQPPPTTPE